MFVVKACRFAKTGVNRFLFCIHKIAGFTMSVIVDTPVICELAEFSFQRIVLRIDIN